MSSPNINWKVVASQLKERLRAAGVDVEGLPLLCRCKVCRGREELEVTRDFVRGAWVVWCGCGHSTDEHQSLRPAMDEWNTRNSWLRIAGRG